MTVTTSTPLEFYHHVQVVGQKCDYVNGEYSYFTMLNGRPAYAQAQNNAANDCFILWYSTKNQAWLITPVWVLDENKFCRAFAMSRSSCFDPTMSTHWCAVRWTDGEPEPDDFMGVIPLSELAPPDTYKVPEIPTYIVVAGRNGEGSEELNGLYRLVEDERIVPLCQRLPVQYPTYQKVDQKDPMVLWFNHYDRYWCLSKKDEVRPYLVGECEIDAVVQSAEFDPCAIESLWHVRLADYRGWDMDQYMYIYPIERNLILPETTFFSPNYNPDNIEDLEEEEGLKEFCLARVKSEWQEDLPEATPPPPSLCLVVSLEAGDPEVLVDYRSTTSC